MKGYGQFCPVAKAAEIVAERWTLLVLRELLCGSRRFSDLHRGVPLMSRTLLADRMRALERAEVVQRRTGPTGRTLEYRLTPAGRDLQPVVQAIGEWGATWSFTEPRAEELDPDLLIVWMARHVDHRRLPSDRTVMQFDFRDPKRRYWMVLEPADVSVCLQHPGSAVDLHVGVYTAALYRVYMGRVELGDAMRAGLLTLSGPRALHTRSAGCSPGARSPGRPRGAGPPDGRGAPRRPPPGADLRPSLTSGRSRPRDAGPAIRGRSRADRFGGSAATRRLSGGAGTRPSSPTPCAAQSARDDHRPRGRAAMEPGPPQPRRPCAGRNHGDGRRVESR